MILILVEETYTYVYNVMMHEFVIWCTYDYAQTLKLEKKTTPIYIETKVLLFQNLSSHIKDFFSYTTLQLKKMYTIAGIFFCYLPWRRHHHSYFPQNPSMCCLRYKSAFFVYISFMCKYKSHPFQLTSKGG